MTASRLPIWPRSSAPRIDTGTSARSSSPSVRTPRERSHRRSPPATTVSTTSLTVPPKASLTTLKSLSSLRISTSRRCGPIGTFNGVCGAGLSAAQATSASPSTDSRTACSELSGRAAARSVRPATENGSSTRPRTPRAAIPTALGSGCGIHGSPSCGIGGGVGSRSNSTVARSTPATPSTSA